MTAVLMIAAAWLLLSLLAAGLFGAICHGAELEESAVVDERAMAEWSQRAGRV